MPLYAFPGGIPVGSFDNLAGTPNVISLTAQAAGNSQNGFIAPSDYILVTAATAGNLSVTLPDPNKYGGTPGDLFTVVNGASGQTLNVFPPTGGNISGAGANTAATIANNKTSQFRLVSYTATTSVWTSMAGA